MYSFHSPNLMHEKLGFLRSDKRNKEIPKAFPPSKLPVIPSSDPALKLCLHIVQPSVARAFEIHKGILRHLHRLQPCLVTCQRAASLACHPPAHQTPMPCHHPAHPATLACHHPAREQATSRACAMKFVLFVNYMKAVCHVAEPKSQLMSNDSETSGTSFA